MSCTRSQKLLSGVSTLAVLAAFGAVDPVLAAGTTVTGPGFFVNIDTTVTNPPGTTGGNNDFIVVENDAIITTSAGRSFFNASTVNVGTGAIAVLIDDATLQGSFVNAGTLTGTGDGIAIQAAARLEGGLTNNGTIDGGNTGIDISASTLLGGLTNTGSISGGTFGVYLQAGASLQGGVNNTGAITGGSAGIRLDASSLSGGVVNGGVLSGASAGISVLTGSGLSGGVNNTGTIGGAASANGIVVDASTWNGGIVNGGLISGTAIGVSIADSAFAGGIANTGAIEGSAGVGIHLLNSTFTGGIQNTGTTSQLTAGATAAIFIDTGVNFAGGISNDGLMTGPQAILINSGNVFADGITNTGTMQGTTGNAVTITADLFTGGLSNSGLLDGVGNALLVSGTVFEGGINNNGGTMLAAASSVIHVSADLFDGGIQNSGLIANSDPGTADAGIMINLDGATFLGGVDNVSGSILAEAETAIFVANTVLFSGGIANGGIISSTGAAAIVIDAGVPLFEGGITNRSASQITGGPTAIAINNPVFLGGISNDGAIQASTFGINVAATNTLFDGGITNVGAIQATGTGIAINLEGVTFNGGITNDGGLIFVNEGAAAINVAGGTFNGGINNSGVIDNGGAGIAILTQTAGAFTGGITNSGSIDGGSGAAAILVNDAVLFAGGITNTGTIESGVTGGQGVLIAAPLFTGGIANNGGTIHGFGDAVLLQGDNFEGGITNTGTIVSTVGGGGMGILASFDTFTGGISNSAAGALIQGQTGILVAGTTFTGGVTNAGIITGTNGEGILISTGTFSGGFANSGTITGAGTNSAVLIAVDSYAGGLTNSGLIAGASGGVLISMSNFSGGFANSGTITTADDLGVLISGSTWTGGFTNDGLIAGGTGIAGAGTGVLVGVTNFNGSFVNNGTINSGVVSGDGVVLSGSLFSGDVVNAGTITATGVSGTGLILNHSLYGGNVENSGKITAPNVGILVNGDVAGTLTNAGDIDPLIGIQVNGVILGGIVNSGSIVATSTAIDVSGAGGAHTITQTGGLIRGNTLPDGTGTIATALNMDNGFDDTFIGAGGVLDGNIVGSGGEGGGGDDFFVAGPFSYLRGSATDIDQLAFIGGPGAFGIVDANADGFDDRDAEDGLVDGLTFGSASELGGVLTFEANDMQVGDSGFALIGDQATITLANELNVIGNGTVAFLLTPNTAQHGAINADAVNFCASPSGLPGPFTCEGTIGGNLMAVVDPVLFGRGTTGAGVFDYNNVITGLVTNTPVDIIPATPELDIATNSMFFTAVALIDPSDIDLLLTRIDFGDSAGLIGFIQTRNQQAVGNALEEIFLDTQPFSQQFQDLFAALIGSTDEARARRIYDELHGSQYAQLLGSTLSLSGILNTFMEERLDATLLTTGGTRIASLEAAERRYAQALALYGSDATGGATYYGGSHGLVTGGPNSVWLRGFGQWANVDADPEAPGFDQDSDGLAAGYDYALGPNSTIGGALSYASTDADFDKPGSSADIDSWQLGLYGNYGFGNFYADGMFSYAWHDISSNRMIDIPTPNAPFFATADYDAGTWSIAGELGGLWPLGRVMMQPSVGLAYFDSSADGFSETGAGNFNLTVQDADADAFTSTLALRAFGRYMMSNTPVLPDLKLGWVHNFNADRHSFTGAWQEDLSVLFPVVGSSVNEDAFLVSGGVTAGVSGNIEVFADVNGLYGSDASTTNASLGLRFVWGDTAAPPAPPPPPPPPAAPSPQQWVVYFGSSKCNITAEAEGVLAQAADVAKSSGGTVSVVGHADTSASSSESQQLSECRANAVKSGLTAKGVSDASINASGKGETDLAVDTADGVKEPQNNRATIEVR